MITVIIFDKSKIFTAKAEKLLSGDTDLKIVKSVEAVDRLEEVAGEHKTPIMVLGPSLDKEEAIGFAETFSLRNPTIGLVWVVDELSSDLMVRALRSGFKDVIAQGELERLISVVRRIAELDNRLREAILGYQETDADASDQDGLESRNDGRIVTFFSTKGGVGKTFIATNVAVGLAAKTKKKVVLVDLDLHFGDVGVMLHLNPERTTFDLLPVLDRLDKEMIKGFLTKHPSGISVLLAPVQPEAADKISSEHLEKILNLLKKIADYVVIDTPPSLNDKILAALDISDTVYLVATMDVPSIKDAKVSLQTMKLLRYGDDKIKLLLNRSDSKVSLKPSEIEKTLEKKIEAFIPSDRLAPQSVNEGEPAILYQPKSNLAKSLNQLVDLVKDAPPMIRLEMTTKERENVN